MNGWNGDLILGGVATFAVASTLVTLACLFWVTRRRKGLPDFTPPVTIFKPLKGLDDGLEANLRSFFALDYPEYQLLFGVADRDDPAIPLVQRLIEEHPGRDARLIIGAPPFGLNPKVENLAAMWPHRKHETVLISDSNAGMEVPWRPYSIVLRRSARLGLTPVGVEVNLNSPLR